MMSPPGAQRGRLGGGPRASKPRRFSLREAISATKASNKVLIALQRRAYSRGKRIAPYKLVPLCVEAMRGRRGELLAPIG